MPLSTTSYLCEVYKRFNSLILSLKDRFTLFLIPFFRDSKGFLMILKLWKTSFFPPFLMTRFFSVTKFWEFYLISMIISLFLFGLSICCGDFIEDAALLFLKMLSVPFSGYSFNNLICVWFNSGHSFCFCFLYYDDLIESYAFWLSF